MPAHTNSKFMSSVGTCLAASSFGSLGSVIGKLALDSSYTVPIAGSVGQLISAVAPASSQWQHFDQVLHTFVC
jgi:hypothetical protein